jgi:hypothetical protein
VIVITDGIARKKGKKSLVVSAEVNNDDSRSTRSIVPHELERLKRRTRSRWRSRKKRRMRSAG